MGVKTAFSVFVSFVLSSCVVCCLRPGTGSRVDHFGLCGGPGIGSRGRSLQLAASSNRATVAALALGAGVVAHNKQSAAAAAQPHEQAAAPAAPPRAQAAERT